MIKIKKFNHILAIYAILMIFELEKKRGFFKKMFNFTEFLNKMIIFGYLCNFDAFWIRRKEKSKPF
jgi:hypothetical protein